VSGLASSNPLDSALAEINVKPKILESKLAQRDEFFGLSDGFKKIFVRDRED